MLRTLAHSIRHHVDENWNRKLFDKSLYHSDGDPLFIILTDLCLLPCMIGMSLWYIFNIGLSIWLLATPIFGLVAGVIVAVLLAIGLTIAVAIPLIVVAVLRLGLEPYRKH